MKKKQNLFWRKSKEKYKQHNNIKTKTKEKKNQHFKEKVRKRKKQTKRNEPTIELNSIDSDVIWDPDPLAIFEIR